MFDSHIRIFKNSAITSKIWHYLSSKAQNEAAEHPVQGRSYGKAVQVLPRKREEILSTCRMVE